MQNRSGTITTGGTAQVFAPANSGRRHVWVQNQSTGDLWVNDLGTAAATQPSLKISPGQLYELPFVAAGAISIYGATTGQAFAARES